MLNLLFFKFKKDEFSDYIHYSRNLEFEQDPDYNYLRSLFKNVMEKNSYSYDYEFDWIKKLNLNKQKSKINL